MELFDYVHEISIVGTGLFLVAGGYLYASWRQPQAAEAVTVTAALRSVCLQWMSYVGVLLLVGFMLAAAPLLGLSVMTLIVFTWLALVAAYLTGSSYQGATFSSVAPGIVWLSAVIGVGAVLLTYWPW